MGVPIHEIKVQPLRKCPLMTPAQTLHYFSDKMKKSYETNADDNHGAQLYTRGDWKGVGGETVTRPITVLAQDEDVRCKASAQNGNPKTTIK